MLDKGLRKNNKIDREIGKHKLKWEHVCIRTKSLQSCPTLCHPMASSLPHSSVHGILQVRTLEWIAMLASKGSSQPKNQTRTDYEIEKVKQTR